MAKATKKKETPKPKNISVKTDLNADQLLSVMINTPVKSNGNKK